MYLPNYRPEISCSPTVRIGSSPTRTLPRYSLTSCRGFRRAYWCTYMTFSSPTTTLPSGTTDLFRTLPYRRYVAVCAPPFRVLMPNYFVCMDFALGNRVEKFRSYQVPDIPFLYPNNAACALPEFHSGSRHSERRAVTLSVLQPVKRAQGGPAFPQRARAGCGAIQLPRCLVPQCGGIRLADADSGRDYGTGTPRQRHDHARHPNCDTAIEGSAQRASDPLRSEPQDRRQVAQTRLRQRCSHGAEEPRSTVLRLRRKR